MSVWQFNAAAAGWIKANSASKPGLSDAEKDTLFDWIEAGNDNGPRDNGLRYELRDGSLLVVHIVPR